MRILLVTAFALLCAGTAQGADVTLNAPVAGGSTLGVSALNAPSFAVTLNGDDQTAPYQAQLQVVDARGLASGGGWSLSLTSTPFTATNGLALPANASTITGVTAGCHAGSSCALPSNTAANADVPLPVSPTATKVLNAASATGLGRIDVDVSVSVAIPAATLAATYVSVLTVAISAGP